jgi:pyrroloquinoline-quinone synthase
MLLDRSSLSPLASRTLERLLCVMDKKNHFAYPHLTKPGLTKEQLYVHFAHEYAVYVRDFPWLIARALGSVPPLPDVRATLAENLYEEQTGGISKTAPHPELFLRMMEGLGFTRAQFAFENEDARLHPKARAYRDFLRETTLESPWQASVALLTVFVEGSVHERRELEGSYTRDTSDAALASHPLVVHYGCPVSALELRRVHAAVEGSHRADAWRTVLSTLDSEAVADGVVHVCEHALTMWQRYRDGVADRMGIAQSRAA